MALASLCAKVKKSRGLQFQAFVVDHDARSGSYDEAKNVSQILLEMGISTLRFLGLCADRIRD
jgi:phosphomannomutase